MRKTVALGAAAALAFMLGGCVGDGSQPTGTAPGASGLSQADEPLEDVYGPPVAFPDDGNDGLEERERARDELLSAADDEPIQTKYGVPAHGRDGTPLARLSEDDGQGTE